MRAQPSVGDITPELVVFGCMRKAGEHAVGSKPVGSTPPQSASILAFRFLTSVAALDSLSDGCKL